MILILNACDRLIMLPSANDYAAGKYTFLFNFSFGTNLLGSLHKYTPCFILMLLSANRYAARKYTLFIQFFILVLTCLIHWADTRVTMQSPDSAKCNSTIFDQLHRK